MGQTSNSGSDEMKKRGSLFYPARVILFDTLGVSIYVSFSSLGVSFSSLFDDFLLAL